MPSLFNALGSWYENHAILNAVLERVNTVL